jgi:hypothetical protein
MSILERPTPPEAQAAEKRPPSDQLRVITAGDVGNIDARLGARGFDVVAVAETEDALVHAVSADEPDAIVVEADLCNSLERVRDLAPDAVLIAVGDHTPPGAVGRIEPGVSGTVMAGLLHALVADGVGAAAVWGLVPAFAQGAAVQVPQSVLGSLLSAKADLLWTYLVNAVNAFSGHAELVAAAGLAVTVSAGVVLTMSAPRTDARPARVSIPAVDRAPNEPAPHHPVFGLSSTTPISTPGPFVNETEPGDQRRPNRDDPSDHDRHDGLGENEHSQGEGNDNHVVNEGSDNQIVNESGDDQIVNEGNDDHGQNDDPHGQNDDLHGKNDDPHGQNEGNDEHGVNEDNEKGKNEDGKTDEGNDQGKNEDTETEADDYDQGENEPEGDQDEGNNDQDEDNNSQGQDV